jgi:type I restriction enzyme M protein
LLEDKKNIGKNLIAYLNGFSDNMREVVDKFSLRTTINTLDAKNLLPLLVKKFASPEVDLSPERIDNHTMGTLFEELIRRFNEQMNENPGEHFTPREVIRLMVRLLLRGDEDALKQPGVIRTIFDCACGSGGMLSIAKEYILTEINPSADIRLFGQEVNDETFAVCKSDMLIKGDDADADNIKSGSSLSNDGHADRRFDYMLVNPPYGKDWNKDKDAVEKEVKKGRRFEAGTPRKNDGQLLFLQHLLSKTKPIEEGGSRIAIVMNGSPLFTEDAGSGESEIRRWILENDWLETIVALPGQLFYNTGITTYIWVLSNRKPEHREDQVLLVNGAATYKVKERGKEKEIEYFARKMRKSLGDKRNELGDEHIDKLDHLAFEFAEGQFAKVFDTNDFGYRKITVERPLRLNFQASAERIARLEEQSAFVNLATSKKKGATGEAEIEAGKQLQESIRQLLNQLDPKPLYKDRKAFETVLDGAVKKEGLKLAAPVKKAILAALAEKDETADICVDAQGNPEADPELRDTENVPLKQDIQDYFEREVKPHVPDAWINEAVKDEKDGQVGKVGYEINFNRHFYQYQPLRPRAEIKLEILTLQKQLIEIFGAMKG